MIDEGGLIRPAALDVEPASTMSEPDQLVSRLDREREPRVLESRSPLESCSRAARERLKECVLVVLVN